MFVELEVFQIQRVPVTACEAWHAVPHLDNQHRSNCTKEHCEETTFPPTKDQAQDTSQPFRHVTTRTERLARMMPPGAPPVFF